MKVSSAYDILARQDDGGGEMIHLSAVSVTAGCSGELCLSSDLLLCLLQSAGIRCSRRETDSGLAAQW